MDLSSRFAALVNGNGEHGDVAARSVAEMAAPVEATGSSDAPPRVAEEKKERDADGRFAAGNKGGPGNPFNRKVAMLKRWLLEVIDEGRIKRIGIKLATMAEEGDVAAARVLFQYVLPKGVEPDRVDSDEWSLFKETAGMMGEVPGVINKPGPELALSMVRGARPMMTESIGGMTRNLLLTPQEKIGDVVEMLKNDPRAAREYLERGATVPMGLHGQRAARGTGGKGKGKCKRGKR